MDLKYKCFFGRRMTHVVVEFCKTHLPDLTPSIDDFDDYKRKLSRTEKLQLLDKMKIFQLQRFSINENSWKEFVDHILNNRKPITFFPKKRKKEFSYESDEYKLTDFRLILQEYLLSKKITT